MIKRHLGHYLPTLKESPFAYYVFMMVSIMTIQIGCELIVWEKKTINALSSIEKKSILLIRHAIENGDRKLIHKIERSFEENALIAKAKFKLTGRPNVTKHALNRTLASLEGADQGAYTYTVNKTFISNQFKEFRLRLFEISL